MSTITVAAFALDLKISPEVLLEQLRNAGLEKSAPSDVLSDQDKQILLGYLQSRHGTGSPDRKKIILVKSGNSARKQAPAPSTAKSADASAAQSNAARSGHNRLIIVGNLGRDGAMSEDWQRRYEAALKSMAEWLRAPGAATSGNFARRMREVFQALRRKHGLSLRHSWDRAPTFVAKKQVRLVLTGQHSFFHAGKVDARNAP